ncbi:hypothetical protein MRX96_003813 [Rhipicephalus microplus]
MEKAKAHIRKRATPLAVAFLMDHRGIARLPRDSMAAQDSPLFQGYRRISGVVATLVALGSLNTLPRSDVHPPLFLASIHGALARWETSFPRRHRLVSFLLFCSGKSDSVWWVHASHSTLQTYRRRLFRRPVSLPALE